MKHAFVLAAAACLASPALAHSIDDAMEACLDQAISTSDNIQCFGTAEAAWDGKLNEVYSAILPQLSRELQRDLRDAERAWLRFRDADFAFASTFYLEVKEGSMWWPASQAYQAYAVRDRVVDLMSYTTIGEAVERRAYPLHEIDQELAECAHRNPSTAGLRRCTLAAAGLWEKALAGVSRELHAGLPGEARDALEASERAWADYKVQEVAFSANYSASIASRLEHEARILDITRTRFHQLNRIREQLHEL